MSCAAMAGAVNRAARRRTWKFTTKSSAVAPEMILSKTLLHFARCATPVCIVAEEFLSKAGLGYGSIASFAEESCFPRLVADD